MTKTSASDWTPWYTDEPNSRVRCLLCNESFAKKPARMLSHLGYVDKQGSRNTGVRLCRRLKPEVKLAFQTCGGIAPAAPIPRTTNAESCNVANNEVEHCISTPTPTMGDSCGGSQVQHTKSLPSTFIETPASQKQATTGATSSRTLHQSTIPSMHAEEARRKCDMAWAEFFYNANIPFAVARSASFKNAVKLTSQLKTTYLPPSYHDIRKRLLDATKKKIKDQVGEKTGMFITTYGATLAADGWSSVTNTPLMNVMCVCPAGEEFLGAIDTSGETKDAKYIAGILKNYIQQLGPQNVVQICTDNASVMRKAAKILRKEWPHLYFQGCMAHALNLLLQDWGNQPWARDVVSDAHKIVKFVKNRHAPLALFRKHERASGKGLNLLSPGATRFATNFLMVSRLLEVKQTLKEAVNDPDWDAYVRTLHDNDRRPFRTNAREVRRLILSEDQDFWQPCANYCTVMKAAVTVLKEFDGKEPCMGNVYVHMRSLGIHVKALQNPPFSMPRDLVHNLESAFEKRRKWIVTDLHYAGALLNPHLITDVELRDNNDARAALIRVLYVLTDTATDFEVAKTEFFHYFHKMEPYTGDHVWNPAGVKELPHVWWYTSGSVGNILPGIARRILAQVMSSSSCERNWSSYSFVHNKARNRLHPSRAEDLVYVYTNSKLLTQAPKVEDNSTTEWYKQTIMSEDSDSDGPVDSDDDDGSQEDILGIPEEGMQGTDSDSDALSNGVDVGADELADLQDWVIRNLPDRGQAHEDGGANEDASPENASPQDVPIATFLSGQGMLNSERILGSQGEMTHDQGHGQHGPLDGEGIQEDPASTKPNEDAIDEELEDTGSSPTMNATLFISQVDKHQVPSGNDGPTIVISNEEVREPGPCSSGPSNPSSLMEKDIEDSMTRGAIQDREPQQGEATVPPTRPILTRQLFKTPPNVSNTGDILEASDNEPLVNMLVDPLSRKRIGGSIQAAAPMPKKRHVSTTEQGRSLPRVPPVAPLRKHLMNQSCGDKAQFTLEVVAPFVANTRIRQGFRSTILDASTSALLPMQSNVDAEESDNPLLEKNPQPKRALGRARGGGRKTGRKHGRKSAQGGRFRPTEDGTSGRRMKPLLEVQSRTVQESESDEDDSDENNEGEENETDNEDEDEPSTHDEVEGDNDYRPGR